MAPRHRLAVELSGQGGSGQLPPAEYLMLKKRAQNHSITAYGLVQSGLSRALFVQY
jgi:hypothetical protein